MSIAYTDVIKGAYQLLGRPSQADLPYQDVIDHAKDVIRGRLLDLKLASRGHTNVIGDWVTPTDVDSMSTSTFVNSATNFIPVRVEWRVKNDTDTQFPRKAEVVSWSARADLYRQSLTLSETYVSFTDNFQKIAFSETLETLSNREYRIVYETLADPTVEIGGTTAALPDLFITLCKYETAFVCLDQVENQSNEWAERRERLRVSLLQRATVEEQRFDKWNRTLYGNKKVKRLGFRPITRD
jgi:hypothetical protein